MRSETLERVVLFAGTCLCFAFAIGCFQESIGPIPSDPETLREELFKAVKYAGPRRCEALIEAGAQVDARDLEGWTPLHYAINRMRNPKQRDSRASRVLIEAEGADINAVGNDGSTPQILAARHGAIEVLDLLIEHGADLGRRGDHGITLLMEAASSSRTEMAGHLIALGADINASADDGAMPISFAARHGAVEVLDLLLEHGATLDQRDKRGMTLLMEAVNFRRIEMVAHLIERGADVNAELPDGGTALFVAVSRGNPAVVRLLIEHGANVNGSEKAASPITFAPSLANAEIVGMLLEAGADVNSVEFRSGMTPLHRAVSSGPSMIEFLLKAGAKGDVLNHEGLTARDLAVESGSTESIRLLSTNF
ncbi:MAG: ankyrin repeat domain-containing protein [Deltaproteobacteria bacterium]|nr:ankyrin repeat domain-containing protein [Deltaproteobacteria bacterium]